MIIYLSAVRGLDLFLGDCHITSKQSKPPVKLFSKSKSLNLLSLSNHIYRNIYFPISYIRNDGSLEIIGPRGNGIKEGRNMAKNKLVGKTQEKEAGKITVNGNGKFDKDGKIILPDKTLTKKQVIKDIKKHTPKKTAEEIMAELDRKDPKKQAKINKDIAKAENKSSKKSKDPSMARENVYARDEWIGRALEKIPGLLRKEVKVNNVKQPTEPVLYYKRRMVCWCAPRAGMLWSNVIYYADGNKEIHKVFNDGQAEDDFATLESICEVLESMPEKTANPKSKKASKKNGKKNEPRTIESIERQVAKLDDDHNAIHIKIVTPEIKEWAESKGYTFADDNEHLLVVRSL